MSEERQGSLGTPRIGVLPARDRFYPSFAAFCVGLVEFGYIEGRTFKMEARFAEGHLRGIRPRDGSFFACDAFCT